MLASLMLVFTAACGGSGGAKAPEGGTGTTSEGNGEAAPKQDTVVVWTYPVHGKYEDELKEHVADLKEKYPHITVQTEVLSWAEGPKKFDVALNAGNPPDLYFHAVDGAYVDTGLALELTPYITDEIKTTTCRERLNWVKSRASSMGFRCTNPFGLGAATRKSSKKRESTGRPFKRKAGPGPSSRQLPRS